MGSFICAVRFVFLLLLKLNLDLVDLEQNTEPRQPLLRAQNPKAQ
jgi:hypothetical protein